jgi:hypothetical protein
MQTKLHSILKFLILMTNEIELIVAIESKQLAIADRHLGFIEK